MTSSPPIRVVVALVVTFLVATAVGAPTSRGQGPTGVALTLPAPSVSTPIGTRSPHLIDRSLRDRFAGGRRWAAL